MLTEALVALGALACVGGISYLLGFFKALRKEFEGHGREMVVYKQELKDTLTKLQDTHNKLTNAQADITTKLSAFEMKLRK